MIKQVPNWVVVMLDNPRRRTALLGGSVVAAMLVGSVVYQSGGGIPTVFHAQVPILRGASSYMMAAQSAFNSPSVTGAASPVDGAAASGVAQFTPPVARMVIEQANVEIRMTHPAQAAKRATDLAASLGGFVESMQSTSDNQTTVSLTVRVPESTFAEYLSRLKSYGTVTTFSQTGQDVTQQYSSLQDTLSELRSEQAAYTRLFKQAGSMKDMLEIQQSLSAVSSQIASYETQAHNLQRSVDLARVNATFTPTPAPVNHPFGTTNPMTHALVQSFDVLMSSLMAIVTLVAWLIPWGAVFGLGVWVVRQRSKSRRPSA